ncbi:MAG: DEAD/DEAH box helicase [Candidatus Nitrosocaldaceae archaeon]
MKRRRDSERDLEIEEILKIYHRLGYNELTEIQKKALPVIVRRINTLLIAATGSGKTEASIIPVMGSIKANNGIKALYITPLKALNRDILRRIVSYGEELGLKVAVRHGDTTNKERRSIATSPPDILITTPESLAIILVNNDMRKSLKNVEWIIVDEIHELLSNKRGSHLSLSLERLEELVENDITRIGLSATIGNINDAARFLVGSNRRCAVLIDKSLREYDIDVVNNIEPSKLAKVIKEYTNGSSNTILFTNTRDEAEYLATLLKNNNIEVDIHHGSLSRVVREETEHKLREGNVGIVVSTSSLELGLDIGSIDIVLHYGSPRQVSRLAQRIGRSRHKIESLAKGVIITTNLDDELEVKAIISRLRKGSIEEQNMHEMPLDVLAHHLVGLAIEYNEVRIKDALSIFSRAYQFRELTIDDIYQSLEILEKNSIIRIIDDKYMKSRSKIYYFENVSTIPDILKFEVIDAISNRLIGSLDQEFVGDHGEKGNIFVLKGNQWRILSVDDKRLRVTVEPVKGYTINIPYWVGELISVDYQTTSIVGRLRDERYKINGIIPNDNTIVIEALKGSNVIVIHSCFGNKINNTLAALLSTIISSRIGYIVEARADAYRIALTSNAKIMEKHVIDCLRDDYDLEPVIIISLTNTHNLNWRTWLVAKRFGLVRYNALYDKKSARLIYERYSKTVVVKEAIKELLHDKYDINSTKMVLEKIRKGKIVIRWIECEEFSNVSKPIIERANRFASTPLSVEQGIIELVKERLEKSKHRLICIRCGKWESIVENKDDYSLQCKVCNSRLITATYLNDDKLSKIIRKRLDGLKLSEEEEHQFMKAWKCASLIHSFGKKALIVLAGYGIGVDTAARILRNCVDDSNLYKMIYDAEKQYIMNRGFWDD